MKNKLRNIECPACKGTVVEDVEKCKHCTCDVQVELGGANVVEKIMGAFGGSSFGAIIFGLPFLFLVGAITEPLRDLFGVPETGQSLFLIEIPLAFFLMYKLYKYGEKRANKNKEKNKVFIVAEDEK